MLRDSLGAVAESSAYVSATSSDGLTVANSSFSASTLQIYDSDAVAIKSNSIKLDNLVTYSAGIILVNSTGSSIVNNVIDGAWDGVIGSAKGADDGIEVGPLTNSTIQGNAINNVWDCGIETSGLVANVRIADNNIGRALFGVGGWFWNSWISNTVSSNTAANVVRLFEFNRADGLYSGEQLVYFQDNTFTGNKLLNQTLPRNNTADFEMRGTSGNRLPSSVFVTGNNVFTGNDFSPGGVRPNFSPASMIVDGGGNVCNTSNVPNGFPLNCGANQAPSPPKPVRRAL
jgi:hypothetical protein